MPIILFLSVLFISGCRPAAVTTSESSKLEVAKFAAEAMQFDETIWYSSSDSFAPSGKNAFICRRQISASATKKENTNTSASQTEEKKNGSFVLSKSVLIILFLGFFIVIIEGLMIFTFLKLRKKSE